MNGEVNTKAMNYQKQQIIIKIFIAEKWMKIWQKI
jgi:hypothetical protein